MKKILMSIVACAVFMPIVPAQMSYGIRGMLSLPRNPATHHTAVDYGGENAEVFFQADRVKQTGQIGFLARYSVKQFWFMSEVMYGQSTTTYSLVDANGYSELPIPVYTYDVKTDYLEMPVTAGVKLGVVEVFSGLFLDGTLHEDNALRELPGYRDFSSGLKGGWLSGVGVNLGKVLVDIRYQQSFGNYAKDYTLAGQDLELKNAPGRMSMSAAFVL